MWLWFAIGQVVNVFRQAHLVAGSAPDKAQLVAGSAPDKNAINSPLRWIYRNLVGLAVREVFAIGLWLLLTHPAAGEAIIAHWFPAYAKFVGLLVEIPFLAAPFGIIFSIGADYFLEKWPWLKRHIPPLGE
jgi:hypothetical protein